MATSSACWVADAACAAWGAIMRNAMFTARTALGMAIAGTWLAGVVTNVAMVINAETVIPAGCHQHGIRDALVRRGRQVVAAAEVAVTKPLGQSRRDEKGEKDGDLRGVEFVLSVRIEAM